MNRAHARAAIERGLTAAPPTLERCEEVVRCAEQRCRRATEKLRAAQAEHIAALIALCHAKAERTRFIASNPDPQMVML